MRRPVRLALGCLAAIAAAAGLAPAGAGASGWLPPVYAPYGGGAVIAHPSVAVDGAGSVYAAWTEDGVLTVSKRPRGSVFEPAQTLEPNVTSSANPDIGVDAEGNAIVVWREKVNADTNVIRQATRGAGDPDFATGPDVNTGTPSLKDNPKLAVNGDGEAVLAIQTPTTGVGTMLVALGTALNGFTAPATPYSEGPNTQVFRPDASINEAGDAVVAWRAFDSGSTRMHAVYRPRDGVFSTAAENILPPNGTGKHEPSVAIDSQGRAMAVWDEDTGGAMRAYERGAGANGTWAFVSNLDSAQLGSGSPVVAFGLFDYARAAWNGGGALRDSTRAPGGTFESPETLLPSTEQPSSLAIDSGSHGEVALVWVRGGATPSVSGAAWDVPFQPVIAPLSPAGHGGAAPDVAVDPTGNAAAVWVDTSPPAPNPLLATAEFDTVDPFVVDHLRVQPSIPTAGEPATYSTVATDDWAVPSVDWTFGSRRRASGSTTSHTFKTPGTHVVTVVATDAAHNFIEHGFEVRVAPAPTRGVDFNASEVSGKVLVSVRRRNGRYAPFRRLGPNDNIPIGSIIDATHGVSELDMATNKSSSKRQRSRFSQGVFKTLQSRKSALTTLDLLGGGNFRKQCKPVGFLAKKRRPHRRLFGSGHGRFRTRGRHSTATVRGTQWLTKDTCSGTLTVVSRGSVKVFDFGTRKTKVVKAGHSYLARSRRR